MTTAQPLTVLVTGATGNQGGAAAAALHARGHRVRALTRRPDAPAAQALKTAGAELVAGSFSDRGTIERALRGTDAVFAVGTPVEAGVEREALQGMAMVDAAAASGSRHYVFSSVASADRATGIPHFDSKFRVEEHLRQSGLPFTIIAPAYFMDNLLAPWNLDGLKNGVFAQALPGGRILQQVAVADIGAFAAHVIDNRERFLGTRVDFASDELTSQAMADIASRASGKAIRFQQVPLDAVRAYDTDLAVMYDWLDRVGYSADISAMRTMAPDVAWHRFEDWAHEQNWSVIR